MDRPLTHYPNEHIFLPGHWTESSIRMVPEMSPWQESWQKLLENHLKTSLSESVNVCCGVWKAPSLLYPNGTWSLIWHTTRSMSEEFLAWRLTPGGKRNGSSSMMRAMNSAYYANDRLLVLVICVLQVCLPSIQRKIGRDISFTGKLAGRRKWFYRKKQQKVGCFPTYWRRKNVFGKRHSFG